jgi:hypothetical protein
MEIEQTTSKFNMYYKIRTGQKKKLHEGNFFNE